MGPRSLAASAAALIAVAVGAAVPGVASASGPRHCGDVRLDRFYHSSAHGLFGAFAINATGTACATAKKVAGKYVRDPYAVGDKPTVKHVNGFACKWRATGHVSQQVSVRCTRSGAAITFADRLPSG
jgi:hypothetical protein